jgi:hypothetical protein
MPLDEYKNESRNWGLITDVFILIVDENELNEDPSIVQIEFLLDSEGIGKWCWPGGGEYVECHAKNIKYWADVPIYEVKSVIKEFRCE